MNSLVLTHSHHIKKKQYRYLYNDDDFNWNYGIALASSTHDYKEAEETLLLIQNPDLRKQYCYLSWLARCYVRNRKPRLAWDLYLKMETSNKSSTYYSSSRTIATRWANSTTPQKRLMCSNVLTLTPSIGRESAEPVLVFFNA